MGETHDNHIVYIKDIDNATDIGEPDFYLGEKSDLSCTIKIKFDVPLSEIRLYSCDTRVIEKYKGDKWLAKQYTNMTGSIHNIPKYEDIFIEARMVDVAALDYIEYITYDFKTFRYYIYSNGRNGSYNREGAKFKPSFKSIIASIIK